jgi:hypothetical protein
MAQGLLPLCLATVLVAGLVLRGAAADLYVSPDGSPAGPGTLAAPYDLATALSGQVGYPGDTFWLREGIYRLGHLNTRIHGAPRMPISFRQVTGERARIDGSITLYDSIGYLVFRDFEIFSSDTNRLSSQIGVGFDPTDITLFPGFYCFVPNVSFINLVVHDQTRHGIYSSEHAENVLIYGCILYNNGWASPDNAEGHGLYIQGELGTRRISENIVFNNSGANVHVYENAPGKRLVGVTLDGNVAFHPGAIQSVRTYRDWIIGVDAPATYADRIELIDNMGYHPPGIRIFPDMQVGRDHINGRVSVQGNYMPLRLLMNNWQTATVSGNVFAPRAPNYLVNLNQTLTSLEATWNSNTYVFAETGGEFLRDSQAYSFPAWQLVTGYDQESHFRTGGLAGTQIFIRPNRFERGRAHIVVYNWDNHDQVSVDVSSVLPRGWDYEVRNVQDLGAAPIRSGVFEGRPFELPMTNLTAALPNGPLKAPPLSGPTFGVFLLQPRKEGVSVTSSYENLLIRWPLKHGARALQYNDGLMPAGRWRNYQGTVQLEGDHYLVVEPVRPRERFYRLQLP